MSTIKFRPHSGEVLNLGCSWFFYLSRISKNFWKQSKILLKCLSQKVVSCTGFVWNDSHFNLMFIISLYPFASFKHGVTLCYHCCETNFTHGTWLSFSLVVKHPYPIWTGSFRSSLNPANIAERYTTRCLMLFERALWISSPDIGVERVTWKRKESKVSVKCCKLSRAKIKTTHVSHGYIIFWHILLLFYECWEGRGSGPSCSNIFVGSQHSTWQQSSQVYWTSVPLLPGTGLPIITKVW